MHTNNIWMKKMKDCIYGERRSNTYKYFKEIIDVRSIVGIDF